MVPLPLPSPPPPVPLVDGVGSQGRLPWCG
jgi:hypothetical protein